MVRTKEPRFVMARETMVCILGARAPVYKRLLVRNRHNNRIEEVELRPAEGVPAIDEGSEGTSYAFRRHELVLDDHPCVTEHPHLFVDPPTDVLKKQLSEYTA